MKVGDVLCTSDAHLRMQERGKVADDVHMIFIATYTIAIDCLLVTCTLFTMFTRRLLVRIFLVM